MPSLWATIQSVGQSVRKTVRRAGGAIKRLFTQRSAKPRSPKGLQPVMTVEEYRASPASRSRNINAAARSIRKHMPHPVYPLPVRNRKRVGMSPLNPKSRYVGK